MIKTFNLFTSQSIHVAALICVCALAISGCSESSDSVSDLPDNESTENNEGIGSTDESTADNNPNGVIALEPTRVSLETLRVKRFRINWQPTAGVQSYRVLENPDGLSGFTNISGDLGATTTTFVHHVPLYARVNAQYLVQACNDQGCVDSEPFLVSGSLALSVGYFKSSNSATSRLFGSAVSVSADGGTMVVGAWGDHSAATGINGDPNDDSAQNSGAVYVFVRNNQRWEQQAYIKADNAEAGDAFGEAVSLSADGNTLAVGAQWEEGGAPGINGDQTNAVFRSGAVYVFVRSGDVWQQQVYIKASNPGELDEFGDEVSLSADGNTLAVGALQEDSAAAGINGDQNDNSSEDAGAVYVFGRSGGSWQQQAYIKASNTDSDDHFGDVSLSEDGNMLAVGAAREDSSATGNNGDQIDNSSENAGAVYVFERTNGVWQQQDYLKASNTESGDIFGSAISLNAEANTLAISAISEGSSTSGVNSDQADNSTPSAGAVYIFVRNGDLWQQQAYLKASNPDALDFFGIAVSLSADGNTLAIGADLEDSAAKGINDVQDDNSFLNAGSAYVFIRFDGQWQQQAYVKASNTDPGDRFGTAVSVSGDGNTLVVGATDESSMANGINDDQDNNSAVGAGAVYVY